MSETILLPVDLAQPESWRLSLPRALDLARGGTLHVLTVIPDFGMSMVGSYFDDKFLERALHDVGTALENWVKEHIPSDQEVHPHVVHGRVYEEIIHAGDRLGVTIIVIGVSTKSVVADYFLGPNASRVVRHFKKSVYVVRD